jgi:hypothetical protein
VAFHDDGPRGDAAIRGTLAGMTMLDADRIRAFRRIAAPVLTAYVDTNPATPRNQGEPAGYLAWLKTQARALDPHIPERERTLFRGQFRRFEKHLRGHPPRARGLVAFSGRHTWEYLPLQVQVEDELHWGRPALKQMLWLLDEHRPAGAVVVSRTEARFLRIWLGEVAEDERDTLVLDKTTWRRKHLVGPGHSAIGKRHGDQRDRVARRVEAHHDRFATGLARRVQRWAAQHELRPVVLVGPTRMVDALLAALPEAFRRQVALLRENLSNLSLAAVHARLAPVLARREREDEVSRVSTLLEPLDPGRIAVGLAQTLPPLQDGRVRELVIARGIGGTVRQCERCGWVDTSADRTCPRCGGGSRRAMPARVIVPELAHRQGVPIEVVAGSAATRLRRVGGIGAWLVSKRRPPAGV